MFPPCQLHHAGTPALQGFNHHTDFGAHMDKGEIIDHKADMTDGRPFFGPTSFAEQHPIPRLHQHKGIPRIIPKPHLPHLLDSLTRLVAIIAKAAGMQQVEHEPPAVIHGIRLAQEVLRNGAEVGETCQEHGHSSQILLGIRGKPQLVTKRRCGNTVVNVIPSATKSKLAITVSVLQESTLKTSPASNGTSSTWPTST